MFKIFYDVFSNFLLTFSEFETDNKPARTKKTISNSNKIEHDRSPTLPPETFGEM
jgi:hypothetical protein